MGLGSNMGNCRVNMQTAVQGLATAGTVTGVSSLYESAPVGPAGQQPYLNAVVALRTPWPLGDLLDLAKRLEWTMGRRPAMRWSSRPIDIDIVLAGDRRIGTARLTVPHAELVNRGFVLQPLAELTPQVIHPVLGSTIAELAAAVDLTGLRIIEPSSWVYTKGS